MPIVPVDPIGAVTDESRVPGEQAAVPPLELATESIAQLEAQAHQGDQAAIRELALRAGLAEKQAAEREAARPLKALPVAHSPAEPGKGERVDEEA